MTLWNVHPCDCHNPKSLICKSGAVSPMISGVIVKSGEKFRLDPDYKPSHLPYQREKWEGVIREVSNGRSY